MSELNRERIIRNLEHLVDKYGENGSYNTYCTLSDSLTLIKELTEENEKLRHNHEKLIEERDTFREYAYNMQKYVENIRHKEEAGYEPSAARYAAEMDMWRVVALEKKELTEENKTLNSLVKVLSENNADLEDELAKTYDLLEESKADTIQKMQEKIRAKSEYGTINISLWQLDQIAKEVLEENDD
jgi:hypothetical protein